MQKYLLIVFTFLTVTGFAQTEISAPLYALSFDTCNVYARTHADSAFTGSGRFVGNGSIAIYRDSVIIEYSNQWECGKYSIQLFDTHGEVDGDTFIWFYRGSDEYRGGQWALMLILDENDIPGYVELFSDFLDDDYTQSGTRRIYDLTNKP